MQVARVDAFSSWKADDGTHYAKHTCTNLQKSRPSGDPWYKAKAAPFRKHEYMIIGPITQPRLVGQQPISHGRTSKCAQVSDAHLMGESCVHGIAFGSPSQEKNGIENIKCELQI